MQRQGGPPNAEGQASGCSVRSVLVDAVLNSGEHDRPAANCFWELAEAMDCCSGAVVDWGVLGRRPAGGRRRGGSHADQ